MASGSSIPALPDFKDAKVFQKGDRKYANNAWQYATTSVDPENASQSEHLDITGHHYTPPSMSPGAIVVIQKNNAVEDIKTALAWANTNKVGVAIRTGGHSYNGCSSCNESSIQIDLDDCFPGLDWYEKPDVAKGTKGVVKAGISQNLLAFNLALGKLDTGRNPNGCFMPTGLCYFVHLGGHSQTGGFGHLTRAFGLLSDHFVGMDVITVDGESVHVKPGDDLFKHMCGGCPGNFGICTHVYFTPQHNADYQYSRAYRATIPYTKDTDTSVTADLLKVLEKFDQAPADYNMTVTIANGHDHWLLNLTGLASWDNHMANQQKEPDNPVNPIGQWGHVPGSSYNLSPAQGFVINFQYSNLDNKPDTYDPKWCNMIKAAVKPILDRINAGGLENLPLKIKYKMANIMAPSHEDDHYYSHSDSIAHLWTFYGVREFNHPFYKLANFTPKVTNVDEWAKSQAELINEVMLDGMINKKGVMSICMMTNYGGPNSMLVKNTSKVETMVARRTTTVGAFLDFFYNPDKSGAQASALDFHQRAKDIFIDSGNFGPKGQDWRLFCFPYGEHDLSQEKVWKLYYDNADDHTSDLAAKTKFDPNGIFSTNPFSLNFSENRKASYTTAYSSQAPRAVKAKVEHTNVDEWNGHNRKVGKHHLHPDGRSFNDIKKAIDNLMQEYVVEHRALSKSN